MTELPECLCVKNGVKTFPSMLILLFSKIPQFRIRRAINFLLTDWNDLNHHMDIHFTVDYPFLFSFAFVVGLYIASHSSHLFKVFNHPYQNCFFSQSIWFIVAFIISSSPIVSLHYELFRLTLLWNRILHCIPLLFPISLHYELFRLTLLWNRILHCIPLLFPIFPTMDFVHICSQFFSLLLRNMKEISAKQTCQF